MLTKNGGRSSGLHGRSFIKMYRESSLGEEERPGFIFLCRLPIGIISCPFFFAVRVLSFKRVVEFSHKKGSYTYPCAASLAVKQQSTCLCINYKMCIARMSWLRNRNKEDLAACRLHLKGHANKVLFNSSIARYT